MIDSMHDDPSDQRDGYRWDDYRHEDAIHALSPGFRRKVSQAEGFVEQWLEKCGRPYIAFSGGKDSVATLGVVQVVAKRHGLIVPVMWHNSGVEWPGVPLMVRRLKACGLVDEFHEVGTPADIPELKRMQARGEISAAQKDKIALFEPVDTFIQERGFTGAAVGLRKEESKGRLLDGIVHGEVFEKKDGFMRCLPVNNFTWRDVFAYIATNKLPLHPIYSAPLHGLENRGRIRLSWWLSTDNHRHGELDWIKRNYPQVFARILQEVPDACGLS